MAVIGRLDDQVDSVLIAPLDRNKRRPAEATEATAQPENPQPTPSQTDVQTPGATESSQNERARREALPVWLL